MDAGSIDAKTFVYWRCAASMSALVGASSILGLVNAPNSQLALCILRVISIAWATGILAVLIATHSRPRVRLAQAAYALVPLPLFPTFWLLVGERVLHNLPLEAFVRPELVCIVYALSTPPSPAISLVMIAIFTANSLGLLWWLGAHARVVSAQLWQPWTILLYGACAVGLALYQSRGQREAVIRISDAERTAALKRLVCAYLAVGDLVNTPLQSLNIALSLLATRCPGAADLRDAMARSVERLHKLNHVFRPDARSTTGAPGDESFDPIEVLQRDLQGAK